MLYVYLLEKCREWGWGVKRKIPGILIEAYRYMGKSKAPYTEMVTIIFDQTEVYINSMNKLEHRRSPRNDRWKPARYSRKRNRENVEKVRQAIEELQQQENARPSKENRASDHTRISTRES